MTFSINRTNTNTTNPHQLPLIESNSSRNKIVKIALGVLLLANYANAKGINWTLPACQVYKYVSENDIQGIMGASSYACREASMPFPCDKCFDQTASNKQEIIIFISIAGFFILAGIIISLSQLGILCKLKADIKANEKEALEMEKRKLLTPASPI